KMAEDVLAQAEGLLNLPGFLKEVDTPMARLRRYMDYRCNDLKVRFLVDMANAGVLDNPELEDLIASDDFIRIEPPRPPSINLDPSHLDDEGFVRFFFDRPVCLHDADRDLLEAHDPDQGDR